MKTRKETSSRYPGTLAAPFLPVEVTDIEMAFPAQAFPLMPPGDDIPDEFWTAAVEPWSKIIQCWFYDGLGAKVAFHGKEGIDPQKAYRHLCCIMGSYQPPHEYKEAAATFLCSLWFSEITDYKKEK